MKKNNYLFIFIVFLVYVKLNLAQQPFFSGNGHYYQFVDTLLEKSAAMAKCATTFIDNKQGYLATITTFNEWEFLMSNVLVKDGQKTPFLAGASVGDGVYFIDDGPEKGTIMYDVINDQSYTYCPWLVTYPSISDQPSCIYSAYTNSNFSWVNTFSCQSKSTFVCEFGGLEEYTFIQQNSSFKLGSTVNHFPNKIQMKDIYNNTVSASLQTSSSNFSIYSYSGLPGLYTFQMILNGTIYNYLHNTPQVDVIYPPSGPDSMITLVGSNFGRSSLKIKYSSSGRNCINIVFLNENSVSCKLSNTPAKGDGLLPIFIEYNGIFVSFRNIPYFDSARKLFYSGTLSKSLFNFARDTYAPKGDAAKNPGLFYYPNNNVDFINRFLSIVQSGGNWYTWVGVNSQNGYFYDLLDNTQVILYGNINTYFQSAPMGGGAQTLTPPFFMQIDGTSPPTAVSPAASTSSYSVIVEYGRGGKYLEPEDQSKKFDTSGGDFIVTLKARGCGHYYSRYGISSLFNLPNDFPTNSFNFSRSNFLDTTTVTISIPPYYGGSYFMYLEIDGVSTENQFSFSYFPPSISKVNTLSYLGGNLTIMGSNFFTNLSIIKVYFNDSPLNQIYMEQNHTILIANLPPTIRGIYKLYVTLGTGATLVTSNTYYVQILKPTIDTYNQNDNNIIIHGNDFGQDPSNAKVYIGSIYKDYIVPTTCNTTQITFTLPSNAQNGILMVSVGGVNSTIVAFTLYPVLESLSPPSVTGGNITLTGKYFSPINAYDNSLLNTSISVSVYSVNNVLNCTQISYEYPYQINCLMVPGTGRYGLYITWANQIISSVNSYASPTIGYTAPGLDFNVGGNTTIIGDQFAEYGLNASIGGIPCEPMKFINTTAISCYFPANISVPLPQQKGLEVSVTVDGLNTKNDAFFYKIHKDCPTTSNGVCDGNGDCNFETGLCSCRPPFIPPLCNSKGETGIKPVPDPNGGTIIVGQGFNFSVQIVYLRELDQTNNQVKLLAIKDIQWENKSPNSSKDKMILFGKFSNESVTINLEMTVYNQSNSVIFAGETIDIPANSIKYIITVNNYSFNSKLNSLQLIYNSMTDSKTSSGCETQQTQANSNKDVNGTVSYLQMMAAGTMMTARFANRLYVDSSIRKSDVIVLESNDPLYKSLGSSEQEDKFNLMTAINIPYFENNTIIDPNFGSLVTTTNSQCKSENKWKIPVIVVCSVVGAAAIACLLMWIIKKKHFSITRTIKLRSLS